MAAKPTFKTLDEVMDEWDADLDSYNTSNHCTLS